MENNIRCALTGETERGFNPNYYNPTGKLKIITWCGKTKIPTSFFYDATHALLETKYQGRYSLCKECAKAIKSMIEKAVGEKE